MTSKTLENLEHTEPTDPDLRHDQPTTGRGLVLTLVALLVLTAVSWVMSHVPLGPATTWVALLIAAVKAALVAIAFMEIRRASATARIMGFVTIAFILLLAGGIVGDLAFR